MIEKQVRGYLSVVRILASLTEGGADRSMPTYFTTQGMRRMSREGRFGAGAAIVSIVVSPLVLLAEHFGLGLNDQAAAVLLVACLLGLVGGVSLIFHSGLPKRDTGAAMTAPAERAAASTEPGPAPVDTPRNAAWDAEQSAGHGFLIRGTGHIIEGNTSIGSRGDSFNIGGEGHTICRNVSQGKHRVKKIRVGDINAPTTFGKNSPITIGSRRRRLPDRGLIDIIHRLEGLDKPRVEVSAAFGNDEAAAFAQELADLFTRAGWQLSGGISHTVLSKPVIGVAFFTSAKSRADVQPAFEQFAQFLATSGLGPVLLDGGYTEPSRIHVGAKP